MPTGSETTNPLDRALPQLPTCALDEIGIREQGARYARLAGSVRLCEREPEAVVIEFDHDFDREVLEKALAVERECCPFFRFELDEEHRRLRVTVTDSDMLAALDAVSFAFEGGDRVTPTG